MSVCPLRAVYPVTLPPAPFMVPRPVFHQYALRSLTGSGSLIGFSGYDDGTFDTEDPAAWIGAGKKWRRRAVSITQNALEVITGFSGNDCFGSVLSTDTRPFSLLGEYVARYTAAGVPSVSGSVLENNDGTETTYTPSIGDSAKDFTTARAANFQFIDGTPYGSSYAGIIPIQAGTYQTGLTTERLELSFDLTVCNGAGVQVAHNQRILSVGTLTEPDTFFDALIRAGGTEGTADTTEIDELGTTEPASTTALSFSTVTAVQVAGTIDNVTRGRSYVLTVNMETETVSPAGTFAPFVEVVPFVATSSRITYKYTVPVLPGFRVRLISAVFTQV